MEELKTVSECIETQEKELISNVLKREDLKEKLVFIEDDILKKVEEEIIETSMKPKFSNETSRKRELRRRLSYNSQYKDLKGEIRYLKENNKLGEISIDKCKRGFTILCFVQQLKIKDGK